MWPVYVDLSAGWRAVADGPLDPTLIPAHAHVILFVTHLDMEYDNGQSFCGVAGDGSEEGPVSFGLSGFYL